MSSKQSWLTWSQIIMQEYEMIGGRYTFCVKLFQLKTCSYIIRYQVLVLFTGTVGVIHTKDIYFTITVLHVQTLCKCSLLWSSKWKLCAEFHFFLFNICMPKQFNQIRDQPWEKGVSSMYDLHGQLFLILWTEIHV